MQDPAYCDEVDYRHVFEVCPQRHMLLAIDSPAYTILSASDQHLEMVVRSREEIVGRSLFEVFDLSRQDDGSGDNPGFQLYRALEAACREGTSQTVATYRYDLPDPSTPDRAFERYWSPRVTPLLREDGSFDTLLFVVEEVTDTVMREQHKPRVDDRGNETENSRRHVLIVEPNAAIRNHLAQTFSTQWSTTGVGSAAEAMETLEQKRPDAVLTSMDSPDDQGAAFVAHLKDAHDVPVVVRIGPSGGRLYSVAYEAGADDVIGQAASAREILARVQAQIAEATRSRVVEDELRDRYYQLFEQAPIAIAVMEGPEKRIILSNPTHDRLIGHRDILGKPVREAFPEQQTAPHLDTLDKVYQTGTRYVATEASLDIDVRDAVGVPEYVTFAYVPFRDADGEVAGVASFSYDVTKQVKMRRQLELENRRKDEFLAMLGHELRNPMAPIATANDILQLTADEPDPNQIRWASDVIGRQVDQLRRLVDDLLDFARINQGQVTIVRAPCTLASILDASIETVQTRLDRHDQYLTIERPKRSMRVNVDKVRLIQAVSNLLDNASKYSPDGAEICLEVGGEAYGGSDVLTITVSDCGRGIAAENLTKIFAPFAQADVTLDRSDGGLGLGLALVERIARMHDGTITAESDGRDQGSRFTLRLPVQLEALAPAPSR